RSVATWTPVLPPIALSPRRTAPTNRAMGHAGSARSNSRPNLNACQPKVPLTVVPEREQEPAWRSPRFVQHGGRTTAGWSMQFLVYLTVLMVSMSVVLLEVHWLTSPDPQPKTIARTTNAPVPTPKVEGPNPALRPVYPKPSDMQRPDVGNAPQAQASVTKSAPTETAEQVAPAATAPAQDAPSTSQPAPTPMPPAPPAANAGTASPQTPPAPPA